MTYSLSIVTHHDSAAKSASATTHLRMSLFKSGTGRKLKGFSASPVMIWMGERQIRMLRLAQTAQIYATPPRKSVHMPQLVIAKMRKALALSEPETTTSKTHRDQLS
jgi:hypothetical protein